ncbi:MAG: diphosphomevalonate decarboxylase [bacterium]
MNSILVQTHANIALIKYWGKRNEKLFLPTKSSISVTISHLKTTTHITFNSENKDHILYNWHNSTKKTIEKITQFLDLFRKKYSIDTHFTITTNNEFPTGAGLASSSSGFAALAIGLDALCALNLTKKEISILARQGSGSACRSVYGGFVQWHKGNRGDGSDSYAEQLFPANHWPELRVILAVVSAQEKLVSSRIGMQQTVATSTSYKQWLAESEQRIPQMIQALENKNFSLVGNLTEADWYGMRQSMLTTIPQLDYCLTTTHDVIHVIQNLRKNNIEAYFTTDAGPNVKILCLDKDLRKICTHLKNIPGVIQVIECAATGDPVAITQ